MTARITTAPHTEAAPAEIYTTPHERGATVTKATDNSFLSVLRQEWERDMVAAGVVKPRDGVLLVVAHPKGREYRVCLRYFTLGNRWVVSVDRECDESEAYRWMFEQGKKWAKEATTEERQ